MPVRTLFCIALFSGFLAAQERPLSVTLQGMELRFAARVEPAGSSTGKFSGGVMPTARGVHRLISDIADKQELGYDVLLEPLVDGQTMQLTFKPLNVTPDVPIEPGYKLLPPPKFPVGPVMHVGDTVALVLLVNPFTHQKLVDYLSLYPAGADEKQARKSVQDFTVNDVQLNLDRPRVWVNGKLFEDDSQSKGGITAHALALYLAGNGAFVISLWPDPRLNLQKAGMLDGNTLTFRAGSSEYRVECASNIAPGTGIYNVYVHHDPAWARKDTHFEIGGADNAAWLIRKP